MGAIVVGHWRGLHHSHVDSSLFEYAVSAFGGHSAWVLQDDCRCLGEQYDSVDDVVAAYPNHTLVALDADPAATELPVFEHPEDAVYLIGADDVGFAVPVGAERVVIPTAQGLDYPLWSWQVASCLMYDRWVKGS